MERSTQPIDTELIIPVSADSRKPCLVHIYPKGSNLGARFPISESELLIGRDEDCDLMIDDQSVSRHHARIEPDVDGYKIMDLKSTNGTYINDELIKVRQLEDGDYIRIGKCIYRFLSGGNIEAEYHEEIYRLTIIDGLTGIHNKRYFLEFLERELARTIRRKRPLSLIMFDIDHFKNVNDQLGHLGGDYTLREVANNIKDIIRQEELFARYGGEEFAVVLPETSRDEAIHLSERIRDSVQNQRFFFEGNSYTITISAGVASTKGEDALTLMEFIQQADEKLYRAKNSGRNRVVA